MHHLGRGADLNAQVSPAALVPRLLLGLPADANAHTRVDGTAVLVDISGFTTLSEQLAATGREGTEQLIATLSRIFTVLLPATDDGGDVIKFAGDALFVLFTGDEHAKHAVHAAWNMNRVLAAIGDIHLPNARARLRMSVGVHSGTFHVLLVGDGSISVILTGGDTSRVLELQSAAVAGQILVSDETAALLPPKQVAADPSTPGAHRLLRAGSVAAASLMALSVGRGSAGERFVPRAFAQRPDLLGGEPEHRWAAIGFVYVQGVPDTPGPDDLARITELTRVVEQAVADTGATMLDLDPAPGGYRYFLTAGAPTTVEDPEGRLLTALQRIVSTPSPYLLRAGATSGRVFSGFVGATYRQTYTVMGDATNLAARLTARAEPGTVLVSRAALDRSTTVFEAEDGGELTVKGKTQSVPVAVVTRPGRRPDGSEREEDSPFVGRTAELKKLVGVRTSAADGFGAAITIVGGAGSGKTRLLARSLEGATMRVVRADGDRYAAAAPYRTLETLLRPLLDIPADATPAEAGTALAWAVERLRPTLLPWLPLFAPLIGAVVDPSDAVDALDDAFRQDRAHTVLGRLFDDLLPTPTCIVIDDAHWVDEASAAALAHVLSGDTPHAVLLSRRDAEGGLEVSGQRIALEGLSDDDAGDLVETLVGHQLLPGDLDPLLARADGNPLYLIELSGGFSSGSETLGIEQLIGERIDALSEAERGIVRRAAVLGWGVPLSLFIRCVGPVELAETEGVAGFLERLDDTMRFRNELFRDVAYEQLNYQTRRELHRAAVAVLMAEPELAAGPVDPMLTLHYEAAGDWANAEASASRTAAAAEEALALEDAVRAYRVAVASAQHRRPSPPELPELWESLGRVAVASGRAGEGLEAYEKARKLTKDLVARARIDRQRAYALNVLGRPDEAASTLRAARRAAVTAGEQGRGILASIAVTEAGIRLRQAHWSDARGLASEAITLLEGSVEGAGDGDKRVLADAYRYHDIAASELEGDEGMIHLPRALTLYDEVGDELAKSKVLSLGGVRAYYRGDWTLAADLYQQAHDAADAAGDVVGAAIESANAAEILIDQGRIDQSRPLIKAALRVFAASDNAYLVAFVTGFAGRAALREGDADAAAAAFAAAAAGFTALDEADSVLDVRVRGIEADIARGELATAREAAAALSGHPDIHGPTRSRLLRLTARIAGIDGDPARAVDLSREAADTDGGTPFERALSLAELAVWSGATAEGAAAAAEARDALSAHGITDLTWLMASPEAVHPSPS